MGIYVRVFKDRSQGASLPRFEILEAPPSEGDFVKLEPGECVDVAHATLYSDRTFITFEEWRVSNINNEMIAEITEEYTLPWQGI